MIIEFMELSNELKSKYGNYNITHKDLAKIISDKSETDFKVLHVVFKGLGFSEFLKNYYEYIFLVREEDLKKLHKYYYITEYKDKPIKFNLDKENSMIIDYSVNIDGPQKLNLEDIEYVNSFMVEDFINKNCKENICLLKKDESYSKNNNLDNFNWFIPNFNWFIPYILNKHKNEGYDKKYKKIVYLMQGGNNNESQLNFQSDYIYQCIDENIEKIMEEQDVNNLQ